jgi:hypothetical protein
MVKMSNLNTDLGGCILFLIMAQMDNLQAKANPPNGHYLPLAPSHLGTTGNGPHGTG